MVSPNVSELGGEKKKLTDIAPCLAHPKPTCRQWKWARRHLTEAGMRTSASESGREEEGEEKKKPSGLTNEA